MSYLIFFKNFLDSIGTGIILEHTHMNIYQHNISLEVMFQALASPVRIEIVNLLGTGRCCVNCIAKELGLPQTVVSQHLRVLRLAGIVESDKQGKFIHYSINRNAIDSLREFLKSLCNCHSNSDEESSESKKIKQIIEEV